MAKLGSVRRGQLITTYGVGSVVAVGDESVMIAGIDRWSVSEPNCREARLERALGGLQGFVLPPATEDGRDIPVVRFPRQHFCPSCKKLADYRRFGTGWDDNRCARCEQQLVPSRFVVACEKGHIDDFPYFLWVHKGRSFEGTHDLKIEAGGATSALKDVRITCSCGAVGDMDGSFGKDALKRISKCKGSRPWLGGAPEECSETPRGLQRGGTNVWFPVVESALSIPPWSEGAFRILDRHWSVLRVVPETAIEATIDGMKIAKGTEFSIEDLVAAVRERRRRESGEGGGEEPLREQEYEALLKGREERDRKQEFVCEQVSAIGDFATAYFERVMVVKRLREVRALRAFTRVLPQKGREFEAPLFRNHPGWLPAIEVRGEGVFLELAAKRLGAWEERPEVRARAKKLDERNIRLEQSRGKQPERQITPRLILLHTLAHALINEWSLDCGYPASALRERLFVSKDMRGLLIYTATSDSAGSLGGIVSQATADRLEGSLRSALARAGWCSADPLCIEADSQGADALNLAACHCCMLLPEVSCEERNLLLDRAMLVGTNEQPGLAFFEREA